MGGCSGVAANPAALSSLRTLAYAVVTRVTVGICQEHPINQDVRIQQMEDLMQYASQGLGFLR